MPTVREEAAKGIGYIGTTQEGARQLTSETLDALAKGVRIDGNVYIVSAIKGLLETDAGKELLIADTLRAREARNPDKPGIIKALKEAEGLGMVFGPNPRTVLEAIRDAMPELFEGRHMAKLEAATIRPRAK